MKKLSITFLLVSLKLHSAASQFFTWDESNPNTCNLRGNAPNACTAKVSITCQVLRGDLPAGTDCLNGISAGEESPWYSRKGSPGQPCVPQSVDVKYEFKICNQNYELDIELDQTQSWMRFSDIEVKFSHAKVLPRQCRSQVLYRTLDLCDVNSNDRRRYPMSVQLDGRVDMPGDDNHCYCYTYRRSTYEWTPAFVPDTNRPTPSPVCSGKSKGSCKSKGRVRNRRRQRRMN